MDGDVNNSEVKRNRKWMDKTTSEMDTDVSSLHLLCHHLCRYGQLQRAMVSCDYCGQFVARCRLVVSIVVIRHTRDNVDL